MSKSKGAMRVLQGYILPEKEQQQEENESGNDSDEEDTVPEFLDMQEMSNASSGKGVYHQSSVPSRRKVQFQTLGGRVVSVMGRFALRAPWWHVTCTAQGGKNTLILKGSACYKLRTDLDQDGWRSIVSLFLVACKVPQESVTMFFERLPKERYVAIDNLMEVLSEFGAAADDDFGWVQSIIRTVSHSVEARRVWASCFYPSVMEHLPVLLPRQFLILLDGSKRVPMPLAADGADGKVDDGDRLLAKLEDIIKTDVWKLGFYKVMFKELKLVRCEAQLKAFKERRLLQKMPRLQHDALWVYDELKRFCTRTGSTYMEQDSLCTALRQHNISDAQVWEALPFLQDDLGVVVCNKQKVALQNLYDYEAGIADCLRCLVNAKRWEIPINVRDVLYAYAEKRQKVKMQKEKQAKAAPALAGKHGKDVHVEIHVPIEPDNIQEPDNSEAKCHKCLVPEPSQVSNEAHHAVLDARMDSTLPPVEVDPYQLQAAEMICANPVVVISGKGGCGKTTVVSLVFRAAVEQECAKAFTDIKDPEEDPGGYPRVYYGDEPEEDRRGDPRGQHGVHRGGDPGGYPGGDNGGQPGVSNGGKEEVEELVEELEMQEDKLSKEKILLTAPTGRAASLLTKKTGFKAYTLHQVMWDFKMATADKNKQWKFEWVRVLVVDEGSLVPVQLLHDVLSMLIKHGNLQKFIILGDVRQLPSIQPGNTLYDLFHSLKVVNYTMEMMNNHRSESELIVKNAQLIAAKLPPIFDDVVAVHNDIHSFSIPDNKRFIHIRLPDKKGDDDLQKAVKLLLHADTHAPGLDNHLTSQFIAFRRADVALINELCCKHYNKHTTKDHEGKLKFQPGDKVCVTKNGYIHKDGEAQKKADGEENVKTEERIRLCNGEIFFIRQDKTEMDERGRCKQRLLTLHDGLDRTVTAEYRELLRECKLRHAWARTIHTFQGSETETIVFVLGAGGGQTWKHVYTAITRGQKRVYVVSTKEELERALKWRETPRYTQLQALVKTQVVQLLQSSPHHHHHYHHRGSPKFTPLKSSPTVQPRWTPSRSQAASGSTTFAPKRLWEVAPNRSPIKEDLDVERGTASNSAAANTESGTPRKQPKLYDSPSRKAR